MHHGLDMQTVAVVAGVFLLWAVAAKWVTRWNVTAPIVFVVAGFAVSRWPLDSDDLNISMSSVRTIAEFALAIMLFVDASRLDLRALRHDTGLTARLLLVGFPLTMAAGALAAKWLWPDASWWLCLFVGAAAAPTDAALGSVFVEDERVPARLRRVLSVESGLNDGLATPFVNLSLGAALFALGVSDSGSELELIRDIGWGMVVGLVGGLLGAGVLVRWKAAGRQNLELQIGITALGLLVFAVSTEWGVNGFVAAFVAGMAFRFLARDLGHEDLELPSAIAGLQAMLVWLLFGALAVPLLDDLGWQHVVFTLAALTVLRMGPVVLSLIGSDVGSRDRWVMAWFGPRGLATVIFVIIAADDLPPEQRTVLLALTLTVVVSVVAHGVSAGVLARRLGRIR